MFEPARTVRAHHDHADVTRFGSHEDLPGRITDVDDDVHLHVGLDGRSRDRPGRLPEPIDLGAFLIGCRVDAIWLERNRWPRLVHVKDGQRRVIPAGDGSGLFERMLRRLGQVHRAQNVRESHWKREDPITAGRASIHSWHGLRRRRRQ
jgi:hypothetical protein